MDPDLHKDLFKIYICKPDDKLKNKITNIFFICMAYTIPISTTQIKQKCTVQHYVVIDELIESFHYISDFLQFSTPESGDSPPHGLQSRTL